MRKTKLIVLLPFLLLSSVIWGQEAEIKKDGNYYFKNISRNVTKKLDSKAESYNTEVKRQDSESVRRHIL